MTHCLNYPRPALAALLLAALPLAAPAQTTPTQSPTQAELLRRGDLVGGRPHAAPPRNARLGATTTAPASADPTLARLLHEGVDVARVPAARLPDLYARFVEVTRDQRRQWNARDWAEASAALTRLNARYEAVRLEIPLHQRVNVRTAQGEFRTLEAAAARRR